MARKEIQPGEEAKPADTKASEKGAEAEEKPAGAEEKLEGGKEGPEGGKEEKGKSDPQAALAVGMKGKESPLPFGEEMKKKFGKKLGPVRAFFGPEAQKACEMVGAKAFTVGNVIVFADDNPDLETVAHEVTHVVQQGGAPAEDKGGELEMTEPGGAEEKEAEKVAKADPNDPAQTEAAAEGAKEKAGAEPPKGESEESKKSEEKLARYEAVTSPQGGAVAQLRTDPQNPGSAFTLPIDTRIVREGNLPAQQGQPAWIKVRVSTGPNMNMVGWIAENQLAQRPETPDVTLDEANRLFGELAGASLPGTNTPIPFHYPPDGCYARAHIMAGLLTSKGYASERVFAVSQKSGGQGGLNVQSNFAADAQQGQKPNVNWWYHVAPIIKVRNPLDNTVSDMVMDPSMFGGPVPIGTWTGAMSPDEFHRVPDGGLQQILDKPGNNAGNGFPENQNLVFTADRNTMFPGDAGHANTPEHAAEQYAQLADRMQYYAQIAQWHELAASIRQKLPGAPATSQQILQQLQQVNGASPMALGFFFTQPPGGSRDGHFPNLLEEMKKKLDPSVMAQIQQMVTASTQLLQQAMSTNNNNNGGANNGGGGGNGGGNK
jgi:hypothetical protein